MASSSDIVRLASDTSGSGPLTVLLHGLTENRHSFDPLLPALGERYRVLRVDLRGHGESPDADSYASEAMAADVAAVIERAAPGQAPLVIGHSLGGIIAATYGARYPVRGVVNIDQSLDLGGMQDQVLPLAPMLRSEAYVEVVSGMLTQMAGPLSAPEQQRLNALRRIDQAVILGVWAPLLEQTPQQLAATVDAAVTAPSTYPYLQIDGLPSGDGYPAWLNQRIAGAVVDDWGLLGHYPHLVDPERFLAAVADFDRE